MYLITGATVEDKRSGARKSLTGNHIPLVMAMSVEEEREAGQKRVTA